MSEWQPIETAPRDGTPVLVWLGAAISEPWAQTAYFEKIPGWEGWVATYGDFGDEVLDLGDVTHWMPLPGPPK